MSKLVGAGWNGKVVRDVHGPSYFQERYPHTKYLLKLTSQRAALNALAIRNHLERSFSSHHARLKMEQMFLLPEYLVRDFTKYPLSETIEGKFSSIFYGKGQQVGIYMKEGGQSWKNFVKEIQNMEEKTDKKETKNDDVFLKLADQLISNTLLLHKLGVIHNDLHAENVLINPTTLQISFIDWDLSIIQTKMYNKNELYEKSEFEWKNVARMLEGCPRLRDLSNKILQHPTDKNVKYLRYKEFYHVFQKEKQPIVEEKKQSKQSKPSKQSKTVKPN